MYLSSRDLNLKEVKDGAVIANYAHCVFDGVQVDIVNAKRCRTFRLVHSSGQDLDTQLLLLAFLRL